MLEFSAIYDENPKNLKKLTLNSFALCIHLFRNILWIISLPWLYKFSLCLH